MEPIGGLPRWLGGIADTGCVATRGSALAVADKAGNLYISADAGNSWMRRDSGLPTDEQRPHRLMAHRRRRAIRILEVGFAPPHELREG